MCMMATSMLRGPKHSIQFWFSNTCEMRNPSRIIAPVPKPAEKDGGGFTMCQVSDSGDWTGCQPSEGTLVHRRERKCS